MNLGLKQKQTLFKRDRTMIKMNPVDSGLLPTSLSDSFQPVKMKKSDSVAVCFGSF